MHALRSPVGALAVLALLAAPRPDAQTVVLGSGCAGASGIVPTLSAPAIPHTGQGFFLDVTGPPSTGFFLFVGPDDVDYAGLPLPLDLSPFGLPGCHLYVDIGGQLFYTTDGSGELRLPATGFAAGLTGYAQAYFLDLDLPGTLGGLSAGLSLTGAGTPLAGDLLFSEIMQNPSPPSGGGPGDVNGEWFEIHNPGPEGINIEGWTLTSSGSEPETHEIDTGGDGLIVPAGGYVVLGRNGTPSLNGGIAMDYVFGTDLRLGNSSDDLGLYSYDGTLIDEVAWDDGATFPDPVGASMQLNSFTMTAQANDFGMFWCESTQTIPNFFGNPDLGSPGAPNESCPVGP